MDDIDREIIRHILEKPQTITELAKQIFDLKDVHDLRKESSFLRYRLTQMIEQGILAYDRKSKRYDLISDCAIGQGVVHLYNINNKEEVELLDSITSGLTVFVYLPEGTTILFLDQPEAMK